MTDSSAPDVPPEVHETLTGSLAEAVAAARDGDPETVRDRLETVATVATHKLPPSPLRERLLHGCSRARDNLEADYGVAVEYLRAMQRRLEGVASEPPELVESGVDGGDRPEPVEEDAVEGDLPEPVEEDTDGEDRPEPVEEDDVDDESVETAADADDDRGDTDEQGTDTGDGDTERADAGESAADEDDTETDD